MKSLKQARKTAKRLAKLNGSSYQSELNIIAQSNGHANWGSYLRPESDIDNSTLRRFVSAEPDDAIDFEDAENIAQSLIGAICANEGEDHLKLACETLTSFILIEGSYAQTENRSASIAELKKWLVKGLRQIDPEEQARRFQKSQARQIYIGDPHKSLFVKLAEEAATNDSCRRAHLNMQYIASMAPTERHRLLTTIINAITQHLNQPEKQAA